MAFSGGEAARASTMLRAQASAAVDRLRGKIPAEVRVDTRVTTGEPHRAVLEVASDVSADLLVMGVPAAQSIR